VVPLLNIRYRSGGTEWWVLLCLCLCLCLYDTVYQCFDSLENGFQTLLCAAKLHKYDAAYTGAPVSVRVDAGHRDRR
jgi:hypothetical protein